MRSKLRRKAIKILKPWHDDISDIRKACGTLDYLCSQCRSLVPTDLEQNVWRSPLLRIIKHSRHCRLCRLLRDTISAHEYDPFKHPQIANYLDGPLVVRNRIEKLNQRPIKQTTIDEWLMSDRRVWPFGNGKAELGEESRNVECDSTHRISKFFRSTVDLTVCLTAHLSSSVASAMVVENLLDLPTRSPSALYRPRKYVKRYLPCYVELKKNPTIPNILDARLRGYGRGPRAQLATLSQFKLSIEAEPTYTYSIHEQPTLHYAFVLDPTRINVDRSRMLLEHCEQHHGSECRQQAWSEAPDYLRLIDVNNWCLVEFHNQETHRCRYVALSYVWGGAQTFTLNENNTRHLHTRFGIVPFLQLIPRTIRDAMLVVQRMKERYLWVDALCIQQDDQFEKHSQIESMGGIYGSAIVTLAAADSLNADAGIPGVAPGSREIFQLVAELQNGDNLLAHLPDDNYVENTPWNSRAWTLQERLLSSRLMIFEGGRLTWRCRGMTAYEHLPRIESVKRLDTFQWLSIKPQYLGLNAPKGYVDGSIEKSRDGRTIVMRSNTFTEYVKVIEQYTHRDMTYPGDVLRALSGLLRIFSICFRSRVHHGLPEALLDAAILWQPAEKLRRRILTEFEIPSWSWAGWVGRVFYEKPFTIVINEQYQVEMKPKECGQERFRPLVRWYTLYGFELRAINGTGLGIPSPLADKQEMPIEWDGMPPGIQDTQSSKEPDLSYAMMKYLNDTHLVFESSISRGFQLAKAITADALDSPLKFSLVTTTPRGHQMRASRSLSGIVILDGSSPLALNCNFHALVVISEAEYLGFGEEEEVRRYSDQGAHFPLYNVMLVEWKRSEHTARRLGIGRVYKDAWFASDPKVQTVVLG